jgi:sugar-specific transcriptional regulator TrmB
MHKFDDYDAIEDYMYKLGFSREEVVIYLHLLELGALSRSELCRATGIPRTSIERKIRKLSERGLLSQSFEKNRARLVAEDPKKLELILKGKEIQLENQLDQNRELLNHLPHFVNSVFELIPNISKNVEASFKSYQGLAGFVDVCNRSLEKAQTEILQISNCEEWRKVFTTKYSNENYVPIRLEKKIGVRALVVDNPSGRKFFDESKNINRQTRFLSEQAEFDGTLLIYTGEVSIMLSSKPYTAILLRSEEIYKVFLNLFNELWQNAKEF